MDKEMLFRKIDYLIAEREKWIEKYKGDIETLRRLRELIKSNETSEAVILSMDWITK